MSRVKATSHRRKCFSCDTRCDRTRRRLFLGITKASRHDDRMLAVRVMPWRHKPKVFAYDSPECCASDSDSVEAVARRFYPDLERHVKLCCRFDMNDKLLHVHLSGRLDTECFHVWWRACAVKARTHAIGRTYDLVISVKFHVHKQ